MSKIGYIRVSTEHQETAPSQKRSERVLCCCYVPIGYPKFLNMSCGGYFFLCANRQRCIDLYYAIY